MLKSIVMLNCDNCGCTFERLAICVDANPTIWGAVVTDLEYAAEDTGWFFYRHKHRCAHCLEDAFYKQEQKKMSS